VNLSSKKYLFLIKKHWNSIYSNIFVFFATDIILSHTNQMKSKAKNSKISHVIISVLFCISFGCSNPDSKISDVSEQLSNSEERINELTNEDWKQLDAQLEALTKDLDENRSNYSADQIKSVNELKGKYAAMKLKKGLEDAKNGLNDFKEQVEGFIEGIKPDSTEK
jgi:hypothetical protein